MRIFKLNSFVGSVRLIDGRRRSAAEKLLQIAFRFAFLFAFATFIALLFRFLALLLRLGFVSFLRLWNIRNKLIYLKNINYSK